MEGLIEYGYWGLFLGSFLAATIIPFSSDVLLVALLVAGGKAVPAIIFATIGNWLGGMTSFGLGWLGKWEWIEKWFKVTPEKIGKHAEKIAKWGPWLALLTWLPGVGDVMAIGLGFYKVDPKSTAFFMLVGKCARYIMWAVIYLWIFPSV